MTYQLLPEWVTQEAVILAWATSTNRLGALATRHPFCVS